MFILLNIKHFYMVELEHLPIAHFLLFYLHASRLTVNTEGPWWWPGGMGMEVNDTCGKPRADAPRALVNTISCYQFFIVEKAWPIDQWLRRELKGRFVVAYGRERFRSRITTTTNRIALDMGTWQEKKYKNPPHAIEKRSIIWTVLGTKGQQKWGTKCLETISCIFFVEEKMLACFYFLWMETR